LEKKEMRGEIGIGNREIITDLLPIQKKGLIIRPLTLKMSGWQPVYLHLGRFKYVARKQHY